MQPLKEWSRTICADREQAQNTLDTDKSGEQDSVVAVFPFVLKGWEIRMKRMQI